MSDFSVRLRLFCERCENVSTCGCDLDADLRSFRDQETNTQCFIVPPFKGEVQRYWIGVGSRSHEKLCMKLTVDGKTDEETNYSSGWCWTQTLGNDYLAFGKVDVTYDEKNFDKNAASGMIVLDVGEWKKKHSWVGKKVRTNRKSYTKNVLSAKPALVEENTAMNSGVQTVSGGSLSPHYPDALEDIIITPLKIITIQYATRENWALRGKLPERLAARLLEQKEDDDAETSVDFSTLSHAELVQQKALILAQLEILKKKRLRDDDDE